MSGLPGYLIERRGVARALGAFVIAASFDRGGRHAALALGDGTVCLIDLASPQDWPAHPAHRGAVLALAAAAGPAGFVSGGDDGRLLRIAPDGTLAEIAAFPRAWVEHVASVPGRIAAAVRKEVHLFDEAGTRLKTLAHPSTVGGIAFDSRGKRIAVAHYDGASLWFVAARTDTPRRLVWKGSHLTIVFHPAAEAVVTAMQENALHGWRLADGQDMRMSGYPAKTESLSFSRNGRWLATSGAEAIVLWPFFGGGPMGKAPQELAGGANMLVTRVACHPVQDVVAAGFADGMVILADIATGRILPVAPPAESPISALAWNQDGTHLVFGAEDGRAGLIDLSKHDG